MSKAKYKTAVMKRVNCPQCGEKYEVRLAAGEGERSGTFICHSSTNPAFSKTGWNGLYPHIWCGARIVYEVNRGQTYVGVTELLEQPNRFRKEPAPPDPV